PEAVKVEVVPPAGQSVQVAPPFPAPAFTATSMPGLYQVIQTDSAGRQSTSAFAVNFVDATQSRLAPATDSGAPSAAGRAEPIRAPREFWEALAVVALIALGLEAALAWWQFAMRSLRGRLALALRVATGLLLVLALLGVGLPQPVDRQATVFVADVSASTQPAQAGMASFVQHALAAKHPDDAYAVVATSGTASVDHPLSTVAADAPALTAQP